MWEVMRWCGAQTDEWFQVATLLDASCAALAMTGGALDLNALPIACAALLRISDCADIGVGNRPLSSSIDWRSWYTLLGKSLEPMLRDQGSSPLPDVTSDELVSQENTLLVALDWQFDLPSIKSWLSLFAKRFHIATEDRFREGLEKASRYIDTRAASLVMWRPAGARNAPRRLAHGLFGLSLVLANALPAGELCPDHITSVEWHMLMEDLQVHALMAPPAEAAPAVGLSESVVKAFSLSVAADLTDLRADVFLAVWCLRSLLAEASGEAH